MRKRRRKRDSGVATDEPPESLICDSGDIDCCSTSLKSETQM